MFTEIDQGQREGSPSSVLEAAAAVALRRVGGVTSASVSTKEATGVGTAASTCELARDADLVQYQLRIGPALLAIATGSPSHLGSTQQDRQWRDLCTRLDTELNVRSALSLPLGTTTSDGVTFVSATLNLYATAVDAFGPQGTLVATVLANHAGHFWARTCTDAWVNNLKRALRTSKTVGPAVGLLMARYTLTHDQARDLLRTMSQQSNQETSQLAAEIVTLGDLPTSMRQSPRSHS
jgi:hypothetical protein